MLCCGEVLVAERKMKVRVRLIAASYSFMGPKNQGMASGPLRYLQAGAEQMLAEMGLTVVVERLQLDETYQDRFAECVAINKKLAEAVKQALTSGEFPLVLCGTCDAALGILSGFEHSSTGIVWCDAHGDFNTPETSPSGFFVGMPLAVATGYCYADLWSQIGNSTAVADERVLLIDVRDLDPAERESVERAAIPIVTVQDLLQETPETIARPLLDALASRVQDIYLHLDVDVLRPEDAPGVDFLSQGGPSIDEMERIIDMLGHRFPIRVAALTAYNPDLDREEKTLQAGLRLISQIAQSAALQRRKV